MLPLQGHGFNPGQELRFPHATWEGKKKTPKPKSSICFLLPHPNRETTVLTCYNYHHLSLNYSSSSNFEGHTHNTHTHTHTHAYTLLKVLSIWVLKFISFYWCKSVSFMSPTTNYSLIRIQS